MVDETVDFQKGAWYNIIVNVYDGGVRCARKRANWHAGKLARACADSYAATRMIEYPDARCSGTRIRGYSDTRVLGYADARVRGYAGTRVLGYANARVPGYAMLGYANARVPRYAIPGYAQA